MSTDNGPINDQFQVSDLKPLCNSSNLVPAGRDERSQIEELRYQRTLAAQELMMERFRKMELAIEKIEKLTENNLNIVKESKFNENQFWASKEFNKDDRVKKATYLGFFILLAIAVGLLIPYFKAEKLVLLNNDKALNAIKKNNRENYREMKRLIGKPDPKKEIKTSISKKEYLVSGKFVNLRLEPTPDAESIATVSPNQVVEKLKDQGTWTQVRFFDYSEGVKKEGWVFRNLFTNANF